MKNTRKIFTPQLILTLLFSLVSVVSVSAQSVNDSVLSKSAPQIISNAKFNSSNLIVADVEYAFTAVSESADTPSDNEEILMKQLMKKISVDYKTEDITIAIDKFDTLKMENNKIGFKGIGEVKIGQSIWNKIDFNVVMNSDKTAVQIKYEVEK